MLKGSLILVSFVDPTDQDHLVNPGCSVAMLLIVHCSDSKQNYPSFSVWEKKSLNIWMQLLSSTHPYCLFYHLESIIVKYMLYLSDVVKWWKCLWAFEGLHHRKSSNLNSRVTRQPLNLHPFTVENKFHEDLQQGGKTQCHRGSKFNTWSKLRDNLCLSLLKGCYITSYSYSHTITPLHVVFYAAFIIYW